MRESERANRERLYCSLPREREERDRGVAWNVLQKAEGGNDEMMN